MCFAATSSMFDFCVRGLGMSEGTAHRAISGTRAAHRYPLVLEMLADGRLHLSGLSLLAPHLTAENHEKLLEEAAGKTKASIRAVLARWFPKPDVPDRVQPLSPRGEQRGLGLDGAPAGSRPRVEPLSEERFAVHFTASARLRDKLEHARNLMSHVSRELEVVIERALDALIRELENKQWGKTDRPRRSRGTKDSSPSRKDKREVYERDDAQCAFVSEDGVRCTSRAFLQYDHPCRGRSVAAARPTRAGSFAREHNLHHAKQVFGRAPVERAIDLRQRKSQPAEPDAAAQKREKLLAALMAQGFKKSESKQVVANVARDATLSMEELLRRAFALLVPG